MGTKAMGRLSRVKGLYFESVSSEILDGVRLQSDGDSPHRRYNIAPPPFPAFHNSSSIREWAIGSASVRFRRGLVLAGEVVKSNNMIDAFQSNNIICADPSTLNSVPGTLMYVSSPPIHFIALRRRTD